METRSNRDLNVPYLTSGPERVPHIRQNRNCFFGVGRNPISIFSINADSAQVHNSKKLFGT